MKIALFCLALVGCVTTTTATPEITLRPLQPGDALALTWSAANVVDGSWTYTKDCGHEVSHPCPYLTFTTRLGIEGDTTVFGSATGGSDANGNPAENHVPSRDPFQLRGDALVLPQRGDDGGLRHETLILPDLDGTYSGDVEYLLFNIPGVTTFHVEGTLE